MPVYSQPLYMSVGIWTALEEQLTLFLKLGSSTNSSSREVEVSSGLSSSPSSVCRHTNVHALIHHANVSEHKNENKWNEKCENIVQCSVINHNVALQYPSVALVHTIYFTQTCSLCLSHLSSDSHIKSPNIWIMLSTKVAIIPPFVCLQIQVVRLSLSSENNIRYQSRHQTETHQYPR